MDEIQLAKQKAQEIVARLFNYAEVTKRPRVENGDGGFDSMEREFFFVFVSHAYFPPCQLLAFALFGGFIFFLTILCG